MSRVAVNVARTRSISVPKSFIDGDKFIKWDEENVTLVTLHVDPKGYILFWKDQKKEVDYVEISKIRDVRNGKFARQPKEQRIRDMLKLGTAQERQIGEDLLTICYSSDLISPSFVNFAAINHDVAKEWCNELLSYAMNFQSSNASQLTVFDKQFAILSLFGTDDGKIPVKRIMKLFCHKDDHKRVELALEAVRLPSKKHEFVSGFTLDDLLRLYHKLCARHDIDGIFLSLSSKSQYITAEKFCEFLNKEQRDPRLNEVLFPYCTVRKAQSIIQRFEPIKKLASDGRLSCEGFLRYLLSDENDVVPREKYDLYQDMAQPLSHYFISSSHNTYLTGHQLTGKSSVEIYRQVLLTGCRCIELDVWDGKGTDEEPVITHGFTMCTEVNCKEVLEAIAESAFKMSDYPLILSFENHCSTKQQAKLARYCRTIFGSMLLVDPLDGHPLEPGVILPSPEALKRRILVKNKKRYAQASDSDADKRSSDSGENRSVLPTTSGDTGTLTRRGSHDANAILTTTLEYYGELMDLEPGSEQNQKDKVLMEELLKKRKTLMDEKGTAGQEVEAGRDMSVLVNYVEPVRFSSFENHQSRNRSYECTSFVETQATLLLKSNPTEFVNFNKRQLSRIYPKGTRVDSSNYMPQIFWNAGCQMVALNFQTLDLPMQLNLGFFEYNAGCGYVLKPDFLRRPDRQFDPFTDSIVDGIVAGTLSIKIISGQFVSDRKCGSFVEVDLFGLPADTVRRKFRTKVIPNNAINPVYDEQPFVFDKIIMPNLASLRLAVFNETGALLGHRILPVDSLRPGYRHISLRSELNQPLGIATLFVYIKVKDYIIDAFADFANALSNPIAYQSELEKREKRAKQLLVLEDEVDSCDSSVAPLEETCGRVPVVDYCEEIQVSVSHALPPLPPGRESSPCPGTYKSNKKDSHKHTYPRTSSLKPPPHSSGTSSLKKESTQPPAVLRSTSVPLNHYHSTPNLHAESQKVSGSRLSVHLTDTNLLEQITVTSLKAMKPFIKLSTKQKSDFNSFTRKHDKEKRTKMLSHQSEMHKLLASLGIQCPSSTAAPPRRTSSQLTLYDTSWLSATAGSDSGSGSEYNLVVSALQRRHTDEMVELCRKHNKLQLQQQQTYVVSQYRLLEQLAEMQLKDQLSRLEKTHKKDVNELKRQLDSQNWDEMMSLPQKYNSNAVELKKAREELTRNHIKLAVDERHKLKDLFELRKKEAVDAHKQLLLQISSDKKLTEEFLQKFYDSNATYQSSLLNGTVSSLPGPPMVGVDGDGDDDVGSEPATPISFTGATYLVDIRKRSSSGSFCNENPLTTASSSNSNSDFSSLRLNRYSLNDVDVDVDDDTTAAKSMVSSSRSSVVCFGQLPSCDLSDDEIESTRL